MRHLFLRRGFYALGRWLRLAPSDETFQTWSVSALCAAATARGIYAKSPQPLLPAAATAPATEAADATTTIKRLIPT